MPDTGSCRDTIGTNGIAGIVRLRPHHLLCTQGYRGKGYSDDFVTGMDNVTEQLRENADALVEITFSTDSICEACPSKYGEGDDRLCRICGDCNWYPVSACRENILSKRYVK